MKIDTVLEAIHAIEAATLSADPIAYLSEREAYAAERVQVCVAWREKYGENDEIAYDAMREERERREEVTFLRLAQELFPVIAPLLAPTPPWDNDEL